ncbi:hypothetical protein CDO52_00170 [Nocardiopsis gilva YIM 90087]|uniref:Uncharacterized protein n=1 Tax=Nocardiopsis gilva YIM 90087 TaxID=1235441 RepID=A0A223RZU3_9ACTN|nr:hypothetical protein [Nocardiopsis gilva]ASU81403.1 hypothetical protein CDO52_00170 [Nocardiopsis gilva YIM 90087]
MYADLLRYYRVDLAEVVGGRGPSPVLTLALVEGLPNDSAFHASCAAEETRSELAEWRAWQSRLQANLLAAELIDFQRENTRAQVGKRYRFTPHRRPGAKKRPRVLTVAEINGMSGPTT